VAVSEDADALTCLSLLHMLLDLLGKCDATRCDGASEGDSSSTATTCLEVLTSGASLRLMTRVLLLALLICGDGISRSRTSHPAHTHTSHVVTQCWSSP
jgi:hypothetical protein